MLAARMTLLFVMVNEGKVIWLCSCRILLRETNRKEFQGVEKKFRVFLLAEARQIIIAAICMALFSAHQVKAKWKSLFH